MVIIKTGDVIRAGKKIVFTPKPTEKPAIKKAEKCDT
jgi:hypothetical protein